MTVRRMVLWVALASAMAAACGKKTPPVARPTPPPPATTAPSTPGRPPAPPEPVTEPAIVPPEPVRDDAI